MPADQIDAVASRLWVAATESDPVSGGNRWGLLNALAALDLVTIWDCKARRLP